MCRRWSDKQIVVTDHNKSLKLRLKSSSPHTTNSDPMSSDGQKTPLIICNLNIAPNVKTLAPKNNIKKNARKLPPFCVQYQNSLNKSNAFQESNLKTMNDFIVQGTLIANHRRRVRQTNHAGHQDSPDIIINCEDDEYVECTDIAMSVFNNINTDLLLSLDCFEMDSFGRLPGDSRTPTPISKPSMNIAPSTSENMIQNQSTSALLAVPAGYRPLSLRASSPNIKSIIRIDLVTRSYVWLENESTISICFMAINDMGSCRSAIKN
ncbi:CLUMA_CG018482, isoform A [Clunio marinus]|uniref:CLUMA_CG018482, isoform A n=1 Tax=Clunio marinus TaxID=568069 RepID=A0A1J1IZR6_9DIPT|nr:CLUMA_CG018482, isoform A [Clunio marinus]